MTNIRSWDQAGPRYSGRSAADRRRLSRWTASGRRRGADEINERAVEEAQIREKEAADGIEGR